MKMLEFFIANIFVMFDGRFCVLCFKDSGHSNGYQLCSSVRRLIPSFVQGMPPIGFSKEKPKERIVRSFNFTLCYTDVFSVNNCTFGDYVGRIYSIELDIKDTIDTVPYIDLQLKIDN
jgi:hypothetical protein